MSLRRAIGWSLRRAAFTLVEMLAVIAIQDGLSNTALLGEMATHDKDTGKYLWQDTVVAPVLPGTRKLCFDSKPIGNHGHSQGLRPFNAAWVAVNTSWIPNFRACSYLNGWQSGGVGGDAWAVKWNVSGSATNPKGVWSAIATRAGGEPVTLDRPHSTTGWPAGQSTAVGVFAATS